MLCPVCGRGVSKLCSINYPRHFGDIIGETALVCGVCRGWASRLFNEFVCRKPVAKTPPALCPECEGLVLPLFHPEIYFCMIGDCGWFGKLDASCDCCDAPMESTGPIIAYGIETYACDACRNTEY